MKQLKYIYSAENLCYKINVLVKIYSIWIVLWLWCPLRFPVKQRLVRLYSHLFCRVFMFYCYLYLITHVGVQHNFRVTWCSCRYTVTQCMVATSGTWTAFLSEAPEFTPSFWVEFVVRVAKSFVFCVVFSRSLFVLLVIALSALLGYKASLISPSFSKQSDYKWPYTFNLE